MVERYLFADEAGCFTFNRAQNVSKYFILCTITTGNLDLVPALLALRHRLLWEGMELSDFFHATTDKQEVRDQVYAEILKHEFRVQATICEKAKAQPQVTVSKSRFYQYSWYFHFKHGIASFIPEDTRLMVTAASLGVKKERAAFTSCLRDVMGQTVRSAAWQVDFRPSMADPCLQVADYCAWAIQRKWERGDSRAFDLIKDRVTYEFDLWQRGKTFHY